MARRKIIAGNWKMNKTPSEAVKLVNEKITNLKNNWEERYEKLAYYIEHDELEKVHLYIVGIDSNVNSDEYSQAIGELDKCDYILEHIEDKYSLSLKNIF